MQTIFTNEKYVIGQIMLHFIVLMLSWSDEGEKLKLYLVNVMITTLFTLVHVQSESYMYLCLFLDVIIAVIGIALLVVSSSQVSTPLFIYVVCYVVFKGHFLVKVFYQLLEIIPFYIFKQITKCRANRNIRTTILTEESECIICLNDMLIGSQVATLDCNHHFHTNCIGRWMDEQQTCPICRIHVIV